MKKKLKVRVNNQYQYIQLLNGIFNLTEMEMRVLSLFAEHQKRLEGTPTNAFSPSVKKDIADKLNKDDFNVLNNYIKRLKDKKAIKPIDDGYVVPDILMMGNTKEITFTIR